jgi:DNA-binding NtrC family response regulator
MPTVLVIDDNRSIATALEVLLSLHEIEALHAASPGEGLAVLPRAPVDRVIHENK